VEPIPAKTGEGLLPVNRSSTLNETPVLSVVLRTRNRPALLAECLESLLIQRIPEMEVVVVNDGGEDVGSILNDFEESLNIVSTRLEPSRGRSGAANEGIRLARGHWLAFADDDDIWLPGGIRALLDAAKSETACYYGAVPALLFPPLSDKPSESNRKDGRSFLRFGRPFSREAMLFENFIPIIGCILPLETVRRCGGIDETLEVFEDWDLFLRLSELIPFHFVDQDVAQYRVFGSAFVTGAGGHEAQIAGRKVIYEKHWSHLSPETLSRMQHFVKAKLIPEAVERENAAWEERVRNLENGLANAETAVEEYRDWVAERDRKLREMWEGTRLEIAGIEKKLIKAQAEGKALSKELAMEPTRQVLVSVVIVNFNGLEHLRACIPSVKKTEKVRFEITVVDNGSQDESCAWLREHHPDVRIIEIGANVGFGEGNRQGILAAQGQWIALLNNDTRVDPGWLHELLRISLLDPSIGASCSTLCLMHHPEILNGIGGGMSKLGYGYDRRYGCPRETAGLVEASEDVFFPTAAAMLISRQDFEEFGFDGKIFMYHEDVDMGWRLRLAGRRVVVCRDSIVFHAFGGTTHSAQGLQWRERMGSRHNFRSILKHAEILTMLKAFKGLFQLWFRMGAYRHIFHVVAWNIYRLPSTMSERRKMQQLRKIRDGELVQRGFISPSPYPAPSPEIPLRDPEFNRSQGVVNTILRPADPSALGRLGFGWYPPHPIEGAMVRPFCGHARCWLKTQASTRGRLELRLHVPPEAAQDGKVGLRVNAKEVCENLSGDLWQKISMEDVSTGEDGLLEIDVMTPSFRPHQLYGNWDFRRLGGAVRDFRFFPEQGLKKISYSGISILITTFRRWPVLKMTLDALCAQSFDGTQIIVMDDGSGDETWENLQRYREEHPECRLSIDTQENTGQGPARNHALKLVEEELVLFLGDDIIPGEGFLKAHLDRQNSLGVPAAVVGFTDWYREALRVTPFMEFVNTEGHQFGYSFMKSREEQPFTCFYTSNISIPRNLLGDAPFDHSFSSYGWEDVELGYRLSLRGVKIVYDEEARAGHYHETTVTSFYGRMLQVGRTLEKLLNLHPELLRNPHMPPESPPSWYRLMEIPGPWIAGIAGKLDRLGMRFPKKILHHLMMIPFYRGRRHGGD